MRGAKRFQYWLLFLLFFAIPIEHKYDKLFRNISLTWIPEGLVLPLDFDPKIYFHLSDIVALGLFFFAISRSHLREFLFEKRGSLLLLCSGLALLSILASPMASYPVIYTRLLHWTTLLSISAVLAVQEEREKLLRTVCVAIFFSALFQAGVAIAQYALQHHLGLRLLKELPTPLAFFTLEKGLYPWAFSYLQGPLQETTVLLRSCGTFSHPNMLGGFLVFSLFATYFLWEKGKKWLTIPLFLQIFALFLTFSRAALYAYILGTLVYFSYQYYHKIKMSLSLAIVVVGSLVGSSLLLFDAYGARGGLFTYTTSSKNSDLTRIQAQNVALQMFQEHPWLGTGYGQYQTGATPFLAKGEPPMAVHNIYFLLATEVGIFAFLCFCGFIASALYQLLRSPASSTLAILCGLFVACIFLGGCDFYLLVFQEGRILLATLFGLVLNNSRRNLVIEKHPLPS